MKRLHVDITLTLLGELAYKPRLARPSRFPDAASFFLLLTHREATTDGAWNDCELMKNQRRTMSLDLTTLTLPSEAWQDVRPLVADDAPALARLMFDAFLGTTDDIGEPYEATEAEIARTFAGDYGAMLWSASFVAHAAPALPLASASVVTLWREAPLLAFSMTAPAAKRSGLAGKLITASAYALRTLGYDQLMLVVTCGNDPAERLYERLGFREISPPETSRRA